jgi:hypothetical protein
MIRRTQRFRGQGFAFFSRSGQTSILPDERGLINAQLAISDLNRFGAVMEGLEFVTNLIGRYAIFEDLYLHKISMATGLLRKAIIKVYTLVLEFLVEARRYCEENTISTSGTSSASSRCPRGTCTDHSRACDQGPRGSRREQICHAP